MRLTERFEHGVGAWLREDSKIENALFKEIVIDDTYGFKKLRDRGFNPLIGVDVGAHVGLASLMMHHVWKDIKTVSFEMRPDNCEVLKKNMERFGDKAEVVNCAMTGDSGATFLYWTPGQRDDTGGCRALEKGSNKISALTPWEIFKRFPKGVDMVKLDCECAEGGICEWLQFFDRAKDVGFMRGEWHGTDQRDRVVKALSPTHDVVATTEFYWPLEMGLFTAIRKGGIR